MGGKFVLEYFKFWKKTGKNKQNRELGGVNLEEETTQLMNKKETDTLEKLVELSLLYDFYGALLKEQKREIFEDYVLNDLSLGEIAGDRGISRQGVHDSIKRCSRELFEYEERLGLIEKFNRIKDKVGEIHKNASTLSFTTQTRELEEIVRLSDEILEEL